MKEVHKPDAAITRLFLPQKPRRGIRYIPSQFALPFTHNGKSYVFHVLTKQCLETVLPVEAYPGDGFDPLIEAMFLVPEDRDECEYYQSISSMMRIYGQKKGVSSYTILPTLGCNARCVYCYEIGRKQVKMTPEIVEQTIRYIQDTHTKDPVTLNWFGGEPLLCPNIIDYICKELQKTDIAYKSYMITNGSLITSEILAKMTSLWNLKRIQVSMDGAESDYLTRKRYVQEGDQYHAVMKAISEMSKAGIKIAVRCNVDDGNYYGIPQFLDDLSRFVEHKYNVFVYFSPLMDVRAGENDLDFWKKLIQVQPLIEKAGFRPMSFCSLSMKFRANLCMADGGGVVIGPDGSLYPCEHCPPESRYGDIFNGVTEEDVQTNFRRTDRVREKCRHCTFLPECTSFSSCPWKDAHCREARELIAVNDLKRLVEHSQEGNPSDEDSLIC